MNTLPLNQIRLNSSGQNYNKNDFKCLCILRELQLCLLHGCVNDVLHRDQCDFIWDLGDWKMFVAKEKKKSNLWVEDNRVENSLDGGGWNKIKQNLKEKKIKWTNAVSEKNT